MNCKNLGRILKIQNLILVQNQLSTSTLMETFIYHIANLTRNIKTVYVAINGLHFLLNWNKMYHFNCSAEVGYKYISLLCAALYFCISEVKLFWPGRNKLFFGSPNFCEDSLFKISDNKIFTRSIKQMTCHKSTRKFSRRSPKTTRFFKLITLNLSYKYIKNKITWQLAIKTIIYPTK